MIGFDKADLTVIGTFLVGMVGVIAIVLWIAVLLGLALHVFTWAYSGSW